MLSYIFHSVSLFYLSSLFSKYQFAYANNIKLSINHALNSLEHFSYSLHVIRTYVRVLNRILNSIQLLKQLLFLFPVYQLRRDQLIRCLFLGHLKLY